MSNKTLVATATIHLSKEIIANVGDEFETDAETAAKLIANGHARESTAPAKKVKAKAPAKTADEIKAEEEEAKRKAAEEQAAKKAGGK